MKTKLTLAVSLVLTLGLFATNLVNAADTLAARSESLAVQPQANSLGAMSSGSNASGRGVLLSVLPWLLVGVSGLLSFLLLRQNGRILLRLDALETFVAQNQKATPARKQPPPSLPLGSAAPDFELPELDGGTRKLADFRGRKVMLMFFNPKCGYCVKMTPQLASLGAEGVKSGPLPIVITTGDAEANRKLLREGGVRCPVLLQEKMEVASNYKAQGTPMGYVLDEQGAIASQLTAGEPALLALANPQAIAASADAKPPGDDSNHSGSAHPNGKKYGNGLANSRIKRDGLKAGSEAPRFTLPLLDGGEVSLTDYRGRRLLLVFSDPDCGPCQKVAPHLERIHREQPDLEVLMVSRRDPEANRQKATALALTFPIALQKSWEISMLYAMFATPIAYLINEEGIITADAAKGVEPILALASPNTARLDGNTPAMSTPNRKELVMA